LIRQADRTVAVTVRELLEPAVDQLGQAGSPSARLDAELLLAFVLGTDRTGLLAHLEAPISDGQRAAFASVVTRRSSGEPVAYIRGVKEFHGLILHVDQRALIPRPETEQLVDLSLAWATDRLTAGPRPTGSPRLRIRDVGTGSGAIAVALAVALRRRRYEGAVAILASDVSAPALELALENVVSHGVADLVELREADLLDHTSGRVAPGPEDDDFAPRHDPGDRTAGPTQDGAVDLLVANLPYIPSGDLRSSPPDLGYEPALALDGGPDGFELLGRLVVGLPAALAGDGVAFLEIGEEQVQAIESAVRSLPGDWKAVVHADLSGRSRIAEVSRA
jgi:release factor glutamine methyltransferase